MRRLSLWLRSHPIVGDTGIAVLVVLFDVLLIILQRAAPEDTPAKTMNAALAVGVTVLTAAPLVLRRKYPLPVAYAVFFLGLLHASFEFGFASVITGCIALYTLVGYVNRKQAAIYAACHFGASIVMQLVGVDDAPWFISLGFTVAFLGLAWALGEFAGARRAYQAELEARLHLLETEREQATTIAVNAERSRIARELHDVVAHSVSVIVVHADGATYALDSDPEAVRGALRTISGTGRDALAELRRLLEVLRSSEKSDQEPRAPQPSIASLPELIERVRAAGMNVRLDLSGDYTGLPAGVALGVHRIVQESLTNTLKHAGPGAAATVTVTRTPTAVDVDVVDDGAGKAHPIGEQLADLSGGNGVIGMRERAHVFGGTLKAGPGPGGGWRVHASIPHNIEAGQQQ